MWVANEGVPRAGKSYDAVLSHVLPALKKGRHVWARLNGLDRKAIANYLKLPLEHVEEHLHLVESKDVLNTFVCTRDEVSGDWKLRPELQNALVVIDEVHEFYVKDRKPLEPQIEAFFALFGQNGGDGVIMTQWLKRTHDAVMARVEKKNSFQKLSAVGMQGSYLVTYYVTLGPAKYQKVGSKKLKYDPAIFPLYHGYAPGADNTEVYEEGTTTVFSAMRTKIIVFGIVGVLGIYGFVSYFVPKHHDAKKVIAVQGEQSFDLDGKPTNAAAKSALEQVKKTVDPPPPPPDPLAGLTDEQKFVVKLADKGRPWLAARADIGGRHWASVEWVDAQGNSAERLDQIQLEALGMTVQFEDYGLRLSAGSQVIVVTPWPRVMPVRDLDATLYDTSQGKATPQIASVASDQGGANQDGDSIASKTSRALPTETSTYPLP